MVLTLSRAGGLALALLAVVLIAPTVARGQAPPKSPPDEWKDIKHANGNFSASFPGNAGLSESKGKTGQFFGSATAVTRNGPQFSVQFSQSQPGKTEEQLLEVYGVKGFARNAKEVKDIKLGDHPGVEYTLTRTIGKSERTFRTRVFVVKDFVYTLNITAASDVTVPEETVAKFFNSFRLLNEDSKPTAYAAKGVDPKNSPMPKKEEPVVKLPVVDEKFVPGKSLFDPKVAAAERAMLPTMRSLPKAAERRVESLGVLPAPLGPQAYGWSPDGKLLAIGGFQDIWLIDPATGRLLRRLPGRGELGFRNGPGIRFSLDGKTLLTHNREAIFLFNTRTGEPIREFPTPGPTLDAILSEDGSTLTAALTSKNGFGVMFAAWNTKDGTRKHVAFPENDNYGWCFAPNGNHLIVAKRKFGMPDKPNPPVEAWNVLNGHRSILPVRQAVLHLSMNEDGRTLLVTTVWNPEVKSDYVAVDMVTGEDRKIYTGKSSDPGRLTADGKYLLTDTPLSPGLITRLIDARTGKEVWNQEYGSSSNYLMSPGGAYFVRTPLFGESELDVLALDDLITPKAVELAAAMEQARGAGFIINGYGNQVRAKAAYGRFNDSSLSELAKRLPQTTIVEIRDLTFQQDTIVKGLPDLARLPALERLEGRQPFGNDPKVAKALGELKNLKALELSEDDPNLEFFKEMNKLEEFKIWVNKNFGDTQLKQMFAAKSLQSVRISGNGLKMTDKGFEGIGDLKELRQISTRGGGGRVTSAVFAHWKKCPKLESVELLDAEMFNKDMAALAAMPNLTRLYLQPALALNLTLTEAGIESLAPLKNLRYLRIETSNTLSAKALRALDLRKLETGWFGFQFADEDMPVLKSMTSLRELWIAKGTYTDKGLDELKGMTHLRRLYITDRKAVSDAKFKELQKALPDTVIFRTY